MPNTYSYPTNLELRQIERNLLPVLEENDPIFQIMPSRDVDSAFVAWEQEDDFVGLQQVRGMNGKPGAVASRGGKRFVLTPGVYGEYATVDEQQITERRGYGNFNQPIDVSDLVRGRQDQLLTRELNLRRYIGWKLLTAGTFSILRDGVAMHTDTFALTTYAGSAWSTPGSDTPLADFRGVKLLARGKSVNFGARAKAYMNSTMVNRVLGNTNSSDLGGRRTGGGNTFNSLADVNKILMDNDLPQIVEYDEGYLDDSGTFQLFLPNNKVAIIGARTDGGRIAEYQMTRNANNPNEAPGSYVKVVDEPNEVPRCIEVHRGHNGGPAIYYPSAIVIMTTT